MPTRRRVVVIEFNCNVCGLGYEQETDAAECETYPIEGKEAKVGDVIVSRTAIASYFRLFGYAASEKRVGITDIELTPIIDAKLEPWKTNHLWYYTTQYMSGEETKEWCIGGKTLAERYLILTAEELTQIVKALFESWKSRGVERKTIRQTIKTLMERAQSMKQV